MVAKRLKRGKGTRKISVYQQKKGNKYAKRDPKATIHMSEEALEMLSAKQIANKIKNPICNIRVTGKRRHKILKRLNRDAKEKLKATEKEAEAQEAKFMDVQEHKKKTRRGGKKKNKSKNSQNAQNSETTNNTISTGTSELVQPISEATQPTSEVTPATQPTSEVTPATQPTSEVTAATSMEVD